MPSHLSISPFCILFFTSISSSSPGEGLLGPRTGYAVLCLVSLYLWSFFLCLEVPVFACPSPHPQSAWLTPVYFFGVSFRPLLLVLLGVLSPHLPGCIAFFLLSSLSLTKHTPFLAPVTFCFSTCSPSFWNWFWTISYSSFYLQCFA